MELVYASLMLHKAGKEINEANLRKVAEAAGIKKTDAEIKSVVAALSGVNIDQAIKEASIPVAAPTVAQPAVAEKKEEKKLAEEEKKSEEQAAAALSALFG